MDSFSIIVTACNFGPFIGRSLQSVHDALALFHAEFGRSTRTEVVVVDDGSTDDTPRVVQSFLAGRVDWRVLRRPEPSNPGAARNAGVQHAQGDLLFFLDGDDLFLPPHLAACFRVMREGKFDYVKSGVRLADPVHPDWRAPIEHSLVINLAVKRSCHDAVGGFPDYHLYRRDGDCMEREADVFVTGEDQSYNRLLAGLFRGGKVGAETVQYVRRPGNAYDRQYEKFRRPRGTYPEAHTGDEDYRLGLAEVIVQKRLTELRKVVPGAASAAASSALTAAREALRSGDWRRAEAASRQSLEAESGNGDLWRTLGAALHGQGRHAEAVDAFTHAMRWLPEDADVHAGAASALASLGRRDEAEKRYRRALQLRPDDGETTARLGVLLAEAGRLEEATALLRRAVDLRPADAAVQQNLGVALAQQGKAEEAARALEEAVRLRPDYAEAFYNLGNVLQGLGRRDEALEKYREAVRLRPKYGEAMNNLGLLLTEAGKHGEAAVVLQQAVRLRPQAVEGHNNLGLAYSALGRFNDAEKCFQEALRLDPGYVEAHNNLGSAYKEQGRLEEALACYQLALWLDPQSASTHYNRSLALLQKGEYAEGWKEYEWRWKRKQAARRTFPKPRWDGSPLEGRTVLLWCEQGLGDAIQFMRYAPLVKAKGGRVVLECPGFMSPLFSTCAGVDELVAEGSALPAFEVQAPLMSLPGLLGTTLETVPANVPYLHAEARRVETWRRLLEGVSEFKIGVVWQGNPHHPWDRWRSFPLVCLAPLAAVEGVRLVSLQKGSGVEQVDGLTGRFAVETLGDLDGEGGAFLDTAAVMKGLDLVVTADTVAAHISGALGVKVWVALSAVADWRWMCGTEITPWYPTMRLFRQATLGDWASVFAKMACKLRRLIAGDPAGVLARVAMAPGELLDRVGILEIKSERIGDATKRSQVLAELATMRAAGDRAAQQSEEVRRSAAALKEVNKALWDIEDALRACERAGDFGPHFVELARSVYQRNDERADIKRRINAMLGSPWGEQKQYPSGP
jgi:tetratricopeptide (TPR) repeat protein